MGHLTANNGSFPQQRTTRVGVVSSKIAKIYEVHAGIQSSGALFFLRGGIQIKKRILNLMSQFRRYNFLLRRWIALQKKYLKTTEDLFSERSFSLPPSATFSYDFKTGLSKPNKLTRLIYYIGKGCPFDYGKDLFTFEEVKSLIESKDRQRFQDTLLNSRKRKKVSTDTTRLVNGNAIVEVYNYIYHPEDYEMRSPISIEGETRLVAIG